MQIVYIWSSRCHCVPQTPSSPASFKSRLVLPFWYRLTQVVLENGCSSSSFGAVLIHLEIVYIQLYSPECTLAENININNTKQNKDRNILINTVQLNTRYTFVNVLTKDITEDALGKFPHEMRHTN